MGGEIGMTPRNAASGGKSGNRVGGAFVYGYYGLNNYGDDLLASAIYENLPGRTDRTRFYFRSYGTIESLIGKDAPSAVFTGFESDLIIGRNRFLSIGRYYLNHWRLFKDCDEFALGGGTLIQSHTSSKSLMLLFGLIVLARIRHLKVNAYGLGIGKLGSRSARILAKSIFNLCTTVNLRDKGSLEAYRNLGIGKAARLTDDMAFTMGSLRLPERRRSHTHIGVTLVEPFINGASFADARASLLGALMESLHAWTANGFKVRLISCQEAIAPGGLKISDKRIFEELAGDGSSLLRGAEIVELTCSKTREVFSDLDLIVGMRFHGHVVGALHGIPFVGFSYDDKVKDLCDSYGMPYRPIRKVTGDWIIESARLAMDRGIDARCTDSHVDGSRRNFIPIGGTDPNA